MSQYREQLYGSAALKSLEEWATALKSVIQQALDTGGYYSVIFHPYLLSEDEGRREVFREFLRALKATDDLWIAPCRDIAEHLLGTPPQQ
ncbi:hypothetical protein G8770_09575 [Aestuariicella hydrocarbonica]|uniref:Uncharacterized protein n=2 Tax=Pseudomaricurvus hydrocarbonicus TaxID=1470433 RepID=A0A9E5JWG5_9GAMM|nr:hypothetical protein [Aestuariicella hydrocarbonica]